MLICMDFSSRHSGKGPRACRAECGFPGFGAFFFRKPWCMEKKIEVSPQMKGRSRHNSVDTWENGRIPLFDEDFDLRKQKGSKTMLTKLRGMGSEDSMESRSRSNSQSSTLKVGQRSFRGPAHQIHKRSQRKRGHDMTGSKNNGALPAKMPRNCSISESKKILPSEVRGVDLEAMRLYQKISKSDQESPTSVLPSSLWRHDVNLITSGEQCSLSTSSRDSAVRNQLQSDSNSAARAQ